MTASNIRNQLDQYLPLLTLKQQELVLGMIKGFLNIEDGNKRISKKQYNKELQEAVERMEKGDIISNEEAKNVLSKW